MHSKQAFNFKTLVLVNAQTMTDTEALLAASLCKVDKVILSGVTGPAASSFLSKVTSLAP